MLEDRDYMRQPDYGRQSGWRNFHFRWTWTTGLVAANILAFIVECIFCGYPPAIGPGNYFALSVEGIKHGFVWQFVTYQFMHAGLLHIFFNVWTILVFGREIEERLRPRRFLTLYFTSGIVGGVVQVIGGMFWPLHFGTAVVGASAGAMGLMAAFATLYPDEVLTIFLLFIPITARAKYFVWTFVTLSVLFLLLPGSILTNLLGGNIANGAHLGGMAMAWFYVRWILKRPDASGWERSEGYFQSQPVKRAEKPADEFEESDVDAVLDKISAQGINSLTSRERAILEEARKRMAKH